MQGEAAAKLDFAIQLAKSRLTKEKQRSYGRRFGSIEGFGAWRCHRYHHKYQAVTATWRSGYASVCKTVYPGSIPGVASSLHCRASSAWRNLASPQGRHSAGRRSNEVGVLPGGIGMHPRPLSALSKPLFVIGNALNASAGAQRFGLNRDRALDI